MKLADIKRHWEESAKSIFLNKDQKVTPTSRDPFLGELERANVLSCLNKKQTVLEIGCGDASHTIFYTQKVAKMEAVDIASPLITMAESRAASSGASNVHFSVSSVLDIGEKFRGRKFNGVISQRCLINLPSWDFQKQALLQIHELLADAGLLLLTEGFQENLDHLNSIRKKMSLSEIKVVDYNRNFTLREFEPFIKKYFEIVEVRNYGTYLFFSRVFHPLAVSPEEPKHDGRLNRVAKALAESTSMPDLEKYSYNLFYVLKKRSGKKKK